MEEIFLNNNIGDIKQMDYNNFLNIRKNIIEKEFSRMNDMQKKAVFRIKGPLLILAGAGSGKTTVPVTKSSRESTFPSEPKGKNVLPVQRPSERIIPKKGSRSVSQDAIPASSGCRQNEKEFPSSLTSRTASRRRKAKDMRIGRRSTIFKKLPVPSTISPRMVFSGMPTLRLKLRTFTVPMIALARSLSQWSLGCGRYRHS